MKSRVLCILFMFVVCGLSLSHSQQGPKQITMTYLFDNYVFKPGTIPAWGFSCFVQGGEKTILFDAGAYGDILMQNARFLGVDLSKTEKIFLSHFHVDHYLGFDSLLNHVHQVPIYATLHDAASNVISYCDAHGEQLVYVSGPIEICDGMYSSGELLGSRGANIYEHALAMDTDSGLVVVVGCSHPHIEDILATLKDGLGREIFAVFGGFHLLDLSHSEVTEIIQKFKQLGVHKCGAGHCTGDSAISWLRQAYGNDFIPTGVGQALSFPTSTVPASGKRMWLSPGTITFPDAEVAGSGDTSVIQVDNITSRDLTVLELSHKNSAYEFVDLPTLPVTVHPGNALFVKIVFQPSAAQTYSDTVRILSDDSMAPARLITVTGSGFIMARAAPNTLYAFGDWSDGGNVRTVDPTSGATRLLGPTGCAQIAGAKVSPVTNEIIGLAPLVSSTSLVRLSGGGGHFATVSTLSGMGWKGMTFRGDTLYMCKLHSIYRWDASSVTARLVTAFPSQFVFSGLAFAKDRNQFLATVGGSTSGGVTPKYRNQFLATVGGSTSVEDMLYEIDPVTWTVSSIGPLGLKPVVDIVLDDAGRLFGVVSADTGQSILVEISPRTGAAKIIGPMGVGGIMALAAQGAVTDVERMSGSPLEFGLLQNYPNPFNPTTNLGFRIADFGFVSLRVFDVLGREVATLVNEARPPGTYTVRWDGYGQPSGMYFYQLRSGAFVETKRMVLIK